MVFITLVLSRTIRLVPMRSFGGFPDTAIYSYRCWLLLLLGLLLQTTVVWAAGFKVLSADTYLERGVYRLNARIDYEFSSDSVEALKNGVPLIIQLQMDVMRKRGWLWDETVASLQQRFQLEYHALARQYVVTNLNSGELRSFPTWSTATDFLGRIDDFPLLDSSLLNSQEEYYVKLQARLDIEALPAPLRLVAYLSSAWRLSSDWYICPL